MKTRQPLNPVVVNLSARRQIELGQIGQRVAGGSVVEVVVVVVAYSTGGGEVGEALVGDGEAEGEVEFLKRRD